MIYSVRGKLVHKENGLAVVECAGVGYACRTTYFTLSRLNVGEEAFLYTYLNIREDAAELFGFADKQELACFRQLLSVSGVGPKAALSILSDISPEVFAITVATGDHKTLTKTKGVGPKLAQRIVLELKDKIGKEQISAAGEELYKGSDAPIEGNAEEAVSALVVLGYTNTEAVRAVCAAQKDKGSLSSQELIKAALKSMSRNL